MPSARLTTADLSALSPRQWMLLGMCAAFPITACGSRSTAPAADTPEGPIFTVGQVEVRPQREGCAAYFPAVNDTRVWVAVEYVVDTQGNVRYVKSVSRGTQSRASQKARTEAVKAAESCRYTPAQKDGQPVAVRMRSVFHVENT